MCAILDANMFGKYANPNNTDMKPVKRWIEKGGGKFAYSPTDKLKKELNKSRDITRLFALYRDKQVKYFDKDTVEAAEKKLKGLASNDSHIIALAQVASVKLLISNDQALLDDFTNSEFIEQGKIYKYKKHKHLLRSDTCP